jgi:polyhydroxyalkanoate synthesis repressor PhaR
MAAQSVLIKKYENRRLYDATNSRYVNLEEVAGYVQRGYDVRVVDVGTGEDITRLILTQIIAEGAKTPDSGFPLDLLRQMVIASGRASQESALRYTRAMLDFYQSTYRAMTPALNPFDFLQNAPQPAQPNKEASAPPQRQPEESPNTDEVNRLKERLAELEKLVASLAPQSTPRKAPRRKSGVRQA